jgi:hypothetical protein
VRAHYGTEVTASTTNDALRSVERSVRATLTRTSADQPPHGDGRGVGCVPDEVLQTAARRRDPDGGPMIVEQQ